MWAVDANSSIEWMVKINEPNHLKWQKKDILKDS